MKSLIKTILLGMLLAGPFTAANALTLGTWNNPDIQASGDYINVTTGLYNDNTYFSLQWMSGGGSLTALGIDQVYYNADLNVANIYLGGLGINDVTTDWSTDKSNVTGGGGFGDFLSGMNQDPGSTSGILPNAPIYFVLQGSYDVSSWTRNSQGALFDVHVRYGVCSGWASDGRTGSQDPAGTCGSTSVPEPGSLLLLGMGLLGIGLVRRKS